MLIKSTVAMGANSRRVERTSSGQVGMPAIIITEITRRFHLLVVGVALESRFFERLQVMETLF
jgi:hypothetical protein